MSDTYRTLASPCTGEFKDRGSKFIAYAFPVTGEADWQQQLESVRRLHPKARHHCFAFRLGPDGAQYRANDDGEPSGTAGRPILGQIDSLGLTNVLVVVVRYFGGTLLGTSGLINAYRESTAEALRNGVVETRVLRRAVRLAFNYALMSDVMNAVKKLQLDILEQHFGDAAALRVAIRLNDLDAKLVQLKALVAKVSPEEAALLPSVSGLEIVPEEVI